MQPYPFPVRDEYGPHAVSRPMCDCPGAVSLRAALARAGVELECVAGRTGRRHVLHASGEAPFQLGDIGTVGAYWSMMVFDYLTHLQLGERLIAKRKYEDSARLDRWESWASGVEQPIVEHEYFQQIADVQESFILPPDWIALCSKAIPGDLGLRGANAKALLSRMFCEAVNTGLDANLQPAHKAGDLKRL